MNRKVVAADGEYVLNVSGLRIGVYMISLFNNEGAWSGKLIRAAE